MAKTSLFDWHSSLAETYSIFSRNVVEYIPQLLSAMLLVVVGWIIALILRSLTRKLFSGLDGLVTRAAKNKGFKPLSLSNYGRVSGTIVFWAVLLFFITAATNTLEVAFFSEITKALMSYLPSVLAGLLIILAGFALSGFTHAAVLSAASSTGVSRSELLARAAQVTVVLTAVVIGVEQLGINIAFITNVLIVVAGVMLFGVVMAFGLGARHFVANVIGAHTAQRMLQTGQHVSVHGVEGKLLEITQSAIVLDTERGRCLVPASLVHEQITEIITDDGTRSSFIGNIFQKKDERDEPS